MLIGVSEVRVDGVTKLKMRGGEFVMQESLCLDSEDGIMGGDVALDW
ncbi:hypothetical protein JD969_04900 [Planctomycetota bacterium]|nr:hypothetical protein JD969_04900 [Planctomycetota bacterium]